MGICIRQAASSDYEATMKIIAQVQDMHVAWRPDIYKPNKEMLSKTAFEESVNNGTFYVAEYDGEVVGILEMIFRHIETPAHVTRDIIVIDAIAVDEKYRGKGIGHQLLDFVKEIKENKGCDAIELQVNARNTAAYEMYKKYGFTEKSVNMELIF